MTNEMLGNQFFMARNYEAAEKELAFCLDQDPKNKAIKRKLIVCYTQLNDVPRALELFADLVEQDIEFIIKADPILDDCPCPELLNNKEKMNLIEESEDYYLIAGILWLYCDINTSISYFKKAVEKEPENKDLKYTLGLIEKHYSKHPAQ